MNMRDRLERQSEVLGDFGPEPLVVNIDRAAKLNRNFRTVMWTGQNLQVTLMSIPAGGEIGLEMHNSLDQFIRVESGRALVMMGRSKNQMPLRQRIDKDYAIVIPAGTWHNIINIGALPLKLYSVYAPPKHPHGAVHRTKEDSDI